VSYPTKESVEMGMRLVAVTSTEEANAVVVEEVEAQAKVFGAIPGFMGLCESLHGHMSHGMFAGNCAGQRSLLFGIMCKMFCAGWAAGRQEVMDEQVKQTLAQGDAA
jgi:hypothetical protein